MKWLIALGAGLAALLLLSKRAQAAPSPGGSITVDAATFVDEAAAGNMSVPYQAQIEAAADSYGLPWQLIAAVMRVESNFNPTAISRADCYGLMQVLCRHGADGVCTNTFPAFSDWQGTTVSDLLDPGQGMLWGVRILAWNIGRFGIWKGVACYNNWSGNQAVGPDGPFANQGYVNAVRSHYEAYMAGNFN